jgi:hypothetical protein
VPRKASELGIVVPPLGGGARDPGEGDLPRRRVGVTAGPASDEGPVGPARQRTPDEVRSTLSRYRSAKLDGRAAARAAAQQAAAAQGATPPTGTAAPGDGDGPTRPLAAATIPGDASRSPRS